MEGNRDDELLADPPMGDHHLGRFADYQAADRLRRRIVIAVLVTLAAGVVGVILYLRHLHQLRAPVYTVPLPEGTDVSTRPRVLTWSGGKARFALAREAPALEALELPDRVLRLADGCESAEVRVWVEAGRTVEVTVIRGEVRQEPLTSP